MAQGLMDRPASGSDLTQPGAATRIHGDQSAAIKALISSKRPKNVILMIGDGMGYAEITGARNYALGAGGFFKGLDALPFTGSYTHYSLNKDSGTPNYVTDSAASGTAWSTGVKTYNGAIGIDIKGNPHRTLIEMAKAAGMATGDVATSEIQDATPAVLVSHVTARKCYPKSSAIEPRKPSWLWLIKCRAASGTVGRASRTRCSSASFPAASSRRSSSRSQTTRGLESGTWLQAIS